MVFLAAGAAVVASCASWADMLALGRLAPVPIGEVQGVVGDDDDGWTHASPKAGEWVAVQGVVHGRILSRDRWGNRSQGFFIQNRPEQADGDPRSSDGLYVAVGRSAWIPGPGRSTWAPEVGAEVVLTGRVQEHYGQTVLTEPRLRSEVARHRDLDAVLRVREVAPPSDPAEAGRYWERMEGMRVRVPAGALAQAGRKVYRRTQDSEIWFIRGDSPLARLEDPFARRWFNDRDAPPDSGMILIGGLGIKAATGRVGALVAPARTFDRLARPVSGPVYFAYGKYSIQAPEPLDLEEGVSPAGSFTVPEPTPGHLTVAVFNVENLYDHRNDPTSLTDAPSDPGTPRIRPPFDYLPASEAEYRGRKQALARQIVDWLRTPDLLLIQEVENQDIGTMVDGRLVVGPDTIRPDGEIDALQEMAEVIRRISGVVYHTAADRDGGDERGINCGYLYRADRLRLVRVPRDHPVYGVEPRIDLPGDPVPYNRHHENPKAINACLPLNLDRSFGLTGDVVSPRAPQTAYFEGLGALEGLRFHALVNHLSARPDRLVHQRHRQAALNAAIVRALRKAEPDVPVLVGGDFNVHPRAVPARASPTGGQLEPLYRLPLVNLHDVLLRLRPANAYTYVWQGQAGTLDQIFVTPDWAGRLVKEATGVVHGNADWPEDAPHLYPYGAGDHDVVYATFDAAVPEDEGP